MLLLLLLLRRRLMYRCAKLLQPSAYTIRRVTDTLTRS
jgi:hypothetical protein